MTSLKTFNLVPRLSLLCLHDKGRQRRESLGTRLEKFRQKLSRSGNRDVALLTRTVVRYFLISLKIKSIIIDFLLLHFRMQRLR